MRSTRTPWFAARLEGPRTYLIVSVVLFVVSIVTAMIGLIWSVLGVLMAPLMLFGAPLVLYVWYRADPVVRQKVPLLVSVTEQQKVTDEARKRVNALEARWAEIETRYETEMTRIERELTDRSNARLRAEARARKDHETKVNGPLRAQIEASHMEQQTDLANLLRTVQRQYMAQALATPITGAHIEGVGQGMQARLVRSGITTAGHITPERVEAVPGFGPQRVAATVAWRQSIEYAAQARMPRAITPVQQQAVIAAYDARRRSLAAALSKSDKDLQAALAEIDSWYEKRPAVLEAQRGEAERLRQSELAEIDGQLTVARNALQPEQTKLDNMMRQLDMYGDVTYRRYLGMALLGRRGVRRRAARNLAACDELIAQIEGTISYKLLPEDAAERRWYEYALTRRERCVALLERDQHAWSPTIAVHVLEGVRQDLQAVTTALTAPVTGSLPTPVTPVR